MAPGPTPFFLMPQDSGTMEPVHKQEAPVDETPIHPDEESIEEPVDEMDAIA